MFGVPNGQYMACWSMIACVWITVFPYHLYNNKKKFCLGKIIYICIYGHSGITHPTK